MDLKDELGNFASQMIYSDQMAELSLVENLPLWQFISDSKVFRLTSEAYRINVAYLVEPYLAVCALIKDVLDFDKIVDINQTMERVDVHKLQPYFVENFFVEAFKKLGGQIYPRKNGRYEILRVPKDIRDNALHLGEQVEECYESICFSKKIATWRAWLLLCSWRTVTRS